MIDAHCHLNEFENIEETISQAKQSGVTKFISCGTNLVTSKTAIALAEKFDEVYSTVGIYPGELRIETTEFLDLVKHPKVVAIGECGLDYTADTTNEQKIKQHKLLKFNIDLAQETRLPLVVHCRNAFDDVFRLVNYDQVQMHCFTGNVQQMKQCINRGWYISFGGIVTFKNSHELREVAKQVPEEKILIETDSPYLSPEPFRGQPNKPANARIVAEALAKIKQTSVSEIDALTTANTQQLFSKINI